MTPDRARPRLSRRQLERLYRIAIGDRRLGWIDGRHALTCVCCGASIGDRRTTDSLRWNETEGITALGEHLRRDCRHAHDALRYLDDDRESRRRTDDSHE